MNTPDNCRLEGPTRVRPRNTLRPSFAAILTLLIALATTTPASAQVLTGGQGGSSSGGGSQKGSSQDSGKARGTKGPMNTEVPFFDPGTETFSYDGRTWSVLDNRAFSARFEKYLAAPEATSEEDNEYRETLDQILAWLSPKNEGGPNVYEAVNLLPKAATYYNDARLCDSLMNAIYGVQLARNNVNALDKMNGNLDQQLRDLRLRYESASEGTATSRGPRKLGQPTPTRGGGGSKAKGEGETMSSKAEEFTRIGGYMARITEIEAMRIANKTSMATSEIQSKIEYQALIVQLFLQRRLEHVVMACRFYRSLFNEGDNTLQFEEGSDVEKTFAQSIGFNPTISTLESTANELIRDVDEGVESFYFHLDKNELESASKRLAEAFIIGEYLPKVRTLKRDEKARVLQFVRDANQLLSAIEVKDYGLAETLVDRMRENAQDFDYSKPLAAIATAKQVCSMRIRKAKNAAMAGDIETYEENIRVATEIWPTNPELKQEFDTIADQADIKSVTLNDLDRLIATRSYRQIYQDKGRYIAATVGNSEREQQLEAILNDIARIDLAINQAQKVAQIGDKYGAWETVEELFKEFSDDPTLSQVRSDLATDVSQFVSALKQAEQLEERSQTGSSLAWFLKARRMYPNSMLAKEGIHRLVDKVLPDDAPDDEPDPQSELEAAAQ